MIKLFCVQKYTKPSFSSLTPVRCHLPPPPLSQESLDWGNFCCICKSVNSGPAQQQTSPLAFVPQRVHRAIWICPKEEHPRKLPASVTMATLPGYLEWKDMPHGVSALDLFCCWEMGGGRWKCRAEGRHMNGWWGLKWQIEREHEHNRQSDGLMDWTRRCK